MLSAANGDGVAEDLPATLLRPVGRFVRTAFLDPAQNLQHLRRIDLRDGAVTNPRIHQVMKRPGSLFVGGFRQARLLLLELLVGDRRKGIRRGLRIGSFPVALDRAWVVTVAE